MITFFSRGGLGRFGIGYRIFTDRWLDNSDLKVLPGSTFIVYSFFLILSSDRNYWIFTFFYIKFNL